MSADGKPAIDPLDVDNYATWSVRMRALLLSKGLWGAVTGDAMEAERDQKALALLILHVKDHHLQTVGSATTSKNAWDTLKATYEAQTNARKLLLRREIVARSPERAAPPASGAGVSPRPWGPRR